jgi:hypothetical protein
MFFFFLGDGVLQGDPHRPHWSVLPASIRDAYGHRPPNASSTIGEENDIHDQDEEECAEPDPVLEEDAFAQLMEAYYGPSLGHTEGPNDGSHTQDETVRLDDHLPAFEAAARAPLYEGANCSRYICTPFA